jgi:hypothetical protein
MAAGTWRPADYRDPKSQGGARTGIGGKEPARRTPREGYWRSPPRETTFKQHQKSDVGPANLSREPRVGPPEARL